jgi:SAM-dependent methyltransferase
MFSPLDLLCCPLTHSALEAGETAYFSPTSGRAYPLVCGIPDFRVDAAPAFDVNKDRYLATLLEQHERHLSFEQLLDYYYMLNPEASSDLHAVHMAHFAVEQEQAETAFDLLAKRRTLRQDAAVLDLGCGLGQYLKTASQRVDTVVGIDLSVAQLVLARKHLAESGYTPLLLAAQAERLPLRSETFSAATAADTIEHLHDPPSALAEVKRVLASGAGFFLSTPNRFSLTPEPHVGIWGLGYWPRGWAASYVQRKLGRSYEDIRLLGFWGLRRMLRDCFGETAAVLLPDPGSAEMQSFSPGKQLLARFYRRVRQVPGLRLPLYIVAPYFQALCSKD